MEETVIQPTLEEAILNAMEGASDALESDDTSLEELSISVSQVLRNSGVMDIGSIVIGTAMFLAGYNYAKQEG